MDRPTIHGWWISISGMQTLVSIPSELSYVRNASQLGQASYKESLARSCEETLIAKIVEVLQRGKLTHDANGGRVVA